MKNSRLCIEIFQRTKRRAGKISVYGGENKTGILTENKPAYGRIKNYGQ